MKAVVYHDYGGSEALRLDDVETPGAGEVLVRVASTTVSTAEMAMRKGDTLFARFVSGLRRPDKPTTSGSEFAGEVTAIGPGAGRSSVGDRVVGSTGASQPLPQHQQASTRTEARA